jgi:hypothetical protein
MIDVWYENPTVLLNNLDQFMTNKNLTIEENINALARFAIYISLVIYICKLNNNLHIMSIIIILYSLSLNTSEKFVTLKENEQTACQKPTKDNPFMNYTVGDLIKSKERNPACKYDNVKNEMRKEFRSHIFSDASDIWGQFISDRNFYTMPNTDIVNDQTKFAEWCYSDSGQCKTTGKNCLKVRDPTYHRGRIISTLEDQSQNY